MMLETLTALTGAPEPLDRGEADPGRQAEPHGGVDEGSRMSRVLLIEDDGETAREIMAELVDRGFEVDWWRQESKGWIRRVPVKRTS